MVLSTTVLLADTIVGQVEQILSIKGFIAPELTKPT